MLHINGYIAFGFKNFYYINFDILSSVSVLLEKKVEMLFFIGLEKICIFQINASYHYYHLFVYREKKKKKKHQFFLTRIQNLSQTQFHRNVLCNGELTI